MAEAKETEKYTLNDFINEANRKLESVYRKPVNDIPKAVQNIFSPYFSKWGNNFYVKYGDNRDERFFLDEFITESTNFSNVSIANQLDPYIKLLR